MGRSVSGALGAGDLNSIIMNYERRRYAQQYYIKYQVSSIRPAHQSYGLLLLGAVKKQSSCNQTMRIYYVCKYLAARSALATTKMIEATMNINGNECDDECDDERNDNECDDEHRRTESEIREYTARLALATTKIIEATMNIKLPSKNVIT